MGNFLGPTPAPDKELPPEAMGLVAQLVQQNYNDYAATAQMLIDGLTEDLYRARAERDLIREGVNEAINGRFMPTPSHLLHLLFPSPEQIAERIKFEKEVTG